MSFLVFHFFLVCLAVFLKYVAGSQHNTVRNTCLTQSLAGCRGGRTRVALALECIGTHGVLLPTVPCFEKLISVP